MGLFHQFPREFDEALGGEPFAAVDAAHEQNGGDPIAAVLKILVAGRPHPQGVDIVVGGLARKRDIHGMPDGFEGHDVGMGNL